MDSATLVFRWSHKHKRNESRFFYDQDHVKWCQTCKDNRAKSQEFSEGRVDRTTLNSVREWGESAATRFFGIFIGEDK